MKFRPLQDYVLVSRTPPAEITVGGILLPATALDKNKATEGVVIATGPGKYVGNRLIGMVLRMGDRVILPQYGGSEIQFNGETYVVLREGDILGVVDR